MSLVWFDGVVGSDPEARAFTAALDTMAARQGLPVDPEDIWVQWLGACLYLAVEIPSLNNVPGFGGVACDLEVCFWPVSAPRGRGLQTGWGDSSRPFDARIPLRDGELDITDNAISVPGFAGLAFSWLCEQLSRPLEVHRWARPSAARIVLADSGDVIAHHGLRLWRATPDIVERLL